MAAEDNSTGWQDPNMFMSEPLCALNSDIRHGDVSLQGIAEFLRGPRIVSEPLDGRTHPEDYVARHWRVVVPAASNIYGLTVVGFGQQGTEKVSFDGFEDPPAEQKAVNADLIKYGKVTSETERQYSPLTPDLSLRVSYAGSPVFAAVERRYPEDEPDNLLEGWSQLVYSRHLLKTGELINKDLLAMGGKLEPSQKWMIDAVHPANKRKVARTLALTTLIRTVRL